MAMACGKYLLEVALGVVFVLFGSAIPFVPQFSVKLKCVAFIHDIIMRRQGYEMLSIGNRSFIDIVRIATTMTSR